MKKLFSTYLRVLAAVLYLQYLSSQFYDSAGDGLSLTVYRILDPLFVLGMLIVVYYAYRQKRVVDDGPDDGMTRQYLEANVIFYSGVALLAALLWSWFGFQFANPASGYDWLWAVIDITMPIMFFVSSTQVVKSEE